MRHFFVASLLILVRNGLCTELLSKSVVTPTDVEDQAAIALDLRDMSENLLHDDFVNARNIYVAGRNSVIHDQDGNETPQKRSLSSLSRDAINGDFEGEPTFSYHMYGLSGMPSENYREEMVKLISYADDFVMSVLADKSSGTLAAEAATALNLWMYVTHELWEAVAQCRMSTEYDLDPEVSLKKNAKGAFSFDEAIAFWIGEDQSNGASDGYALYSLTQEVGALFGTADPEASVNTNIKRLYEEGRALLSEENACGPHKKTMERLYHVVHQMISQMSIPLLQKLQQALIERDEGRIKLYALAVVPQISSCKTSSYRHLKGMLFDRPYDPSSYKMVMDALKESYDCLGIKCEEVGRYNSKTNDTCESLNNKSLAGYTPTSDVHEQSKIDLDILQIKILSNTESYNFASLIYKFGKNSILDEENFLYRSLQSYATSLDRRNVEPWFSYFQEYFDDSNYADIIVIDTLLGSGKWGGKSTGQRSQVVFSLLSYHIMLMYVFAEMQGVLQQCDNASLDVHLETLHTWDEVAAYITGSIEGHKQGGSDIEDGQLIWNLANSLCTEFSVCNSEGYSNINGQIEDLLYEGKGELNARDCSNFKHTVNKLQRLLYVPIMQGILRYAERNQKHAENSMSPDLASGEMLALSILPIVRATDENDALVIERNMILQNGLNPALDGPAVVTSALAPTLEQFDLRCSIIGRKIHVDFCQNRGGANRPSDSPRKPHLGLIAAVVVFTILCTCIAFSAAQNEINAMKNDETIEDDDTENLKIKSSFEDEQSLKGALA